MCKKNEQLGKDKTHFKAFSYDINFELISIHLSTGCPL